MRSPFRRLTFIRQMLLLQVAVVVALIAIGMVLVAWLLRSNLEEQYEQRALTLARTVAAEPGLGDLVRDRNQPAVAARAAAEMKANHALFVVVADLNGIRLAHPDPAQIGKPVSTDPSEALSGNEVALIERGTLGLSARGKVPLRDGTGTVVGEVSAGFDADEINRTLSAALWVSAAFACGALLLGVSASALLARLLKRRTLGLEPAELTQLVREREAVLHGIGEGVLAVDPSGRVTMANAEAVRLLDQEIEPGVAITDLDLPMALRAALVNSTSQNVVMVAGRRVLVCRLRPVQRDGVSLGSVVTLADRTDLETLTGELAAVRSMRDALRAQRHEFANRMHTILGLLHNGETADAVEYLGAVTDFTEASRISDSAAVGSATIRSFMSAKISRAAELGVELRLSETSWVPQKILAPVEVVTVLGNLIDNALDAASSSVVRPACVEVDLIADGQTLVLSVADTGDGIAPEQEEAIFLQGTSSRGPERGLGLAIARQCARDLGGNVELTNPGRDGAPTVFVARLPGILADGDAMPRAPAQPGQRGPSDLSEVRP
jgi:two-component system CitB family sensor kinase